MMSKPFKIFVKISTGTRVGHVGGHLATYSLQALVTTRPTVQYNTVDIKSND